MSLSEFEIIARIVGGSDGAPPEVAVGPGDDCAVIGTADGFMLLTDDALVEGVHFRPGFLSPYELGERAAAVAISDVAAMGGLPRWLLASVTAPPGMQDDLVQLGRGLASRARCEGAWLVGGNLSRGERLVISVTVVGTTDRQPMLRSGARPGDVLAVTGALGGASVGLGMLVEKRRDPSSEHLISRWRRVPSRVAAGRALCGIATSAIDLSDGLAQDLGHIASGSRVGAEVRLERLPLHPGVASGDPDPGTWSRILGSGEDYELLVTLPEGDLDRAIRAVVDTGGRLTDVGRVVESHRGVCFLAPDGSRVQPAVAGWDHFRP